MIKVSAEKPRIGIFVIAYNAVDKLDWTLDRIPKEVWDKVEEVFLFDDCSTDNTYYAAIGYKHTKDIDKLTVHRNTENLRYGGNQKAGYQYAIERGLDIVVMLHADGQYAPECLQELLEPLEKGEADMVFGSRMAAGGDPLAGGMPLYKFLGNKVLTWLENQIVGMNLSEFHSGYRIYSCHALKKIPFMLNSNEWHFDTEVLIQFEEADLRIVEKPIPTYYGDEICRVNGIGYAFNCLQTASKYRLHKARVIKEPKYDISEDHNIYRKADAYSSHEQKIRWIEKERPAEVLEIGTATGYLTAELAKLGCAVTGIEQDSDMAKLAKKYCREMIVGDIENIDLNGIGRYDAIVFGDVLRHVRNQRDVLRKVHGLLKPGGKVLLSLPNISNIWVRLFLLLFGRSDHSRVGIIDDIHLRFFTLKSIKQMAAESGFNVLSVEVTPVPLPVILPATSTGQPLRFLQLFNWFLTKLKKTLFGYQFILVCQPKA
ncbi:MAG TPA: bifunctional glycosyltransferase/class I SAM-dependent methyltransferase [Pyrinomonadaceae bacterium]|nr:bifunctional glycosyltransferase/class I SAM-dependent methyltransferase [Pyrinomonadaceae bacterium]